VQELERQLAVLTLQLSSVKAQSQRQSMDIANAKKKEARRGATIFRLEEELKQVKKDGRSKDEVMRVMDDELSQAHEELAKYMEASPSEEAEQIGHELQTFEGGKYSNTIRLLYYLLLSSGLSSNKVQGAVKWTLQLLGFNTDDLRLPSRTTAQQMQKERGILAQLFAAQDLMGCDEGSAAIAADGATKLGHSRHAVGAHVKREGKLEFIALAIVDLLGDTALYTKEAVEAALGQLAMVMTKFNQSKNPLAKATTIDDLLLKFNCTVSDGCATQKLANQLVFELIVEAKAKVAGKDFDREAARSQMRDFYCWLHKAIGFCNATTRGCTFAAQDQVCNSIEQEADQAHEERGWRTYEEKDDTLRSYDRPTAAGKGHIAVWAVYKSLCCLFDQDKYRRGEEHRALLESKGVDYAGVFPWLSLAGSREVSWLHNAKVCANLVVHPEVGCAHCSCCKEKYQFPAVCEQCQTHDTQDVCVICFLRTRAGDMNKLEKAIVEFLTDTTILTEWLAMDFVYTQLVHPTVLYSASHCAMNCVHKAAVIESQLKEAIEDVTPFLAGAERLTNDEVVGEWTITAENGDAYAEAEAQFYKEGYEMIGNEALRSFRLHPDKDIYELILDVATKSTRHAVSIPESRICGMQNGVQILEDVVTILVGEGKSNTVAAWETALGQVRDGMEAIFDFQISIKAHETCMENFYATYACDSTLTTDLKHMLETAILPEILRTHRRQSADLILWNPTLNERIQFAHAHATNAELESLLGTVDLETRTKRNQTTTTTASVAVTRRNHTEHRAIAMLWKSGDEREELFRCMDVARTSVKEFEEREKRRKQHREEIMNERHEERRKNKERNAATTQQRLARYRTIDLVMDVGKLREMELPQLQDQARAWQTLAADKSIVFRGEFAKMLKAGSGLIGKNLPKNPVKGDVAARKVLYKKARARLRNKCCALARECEWIRAGNVGDSENMWDTDEEDYEVETEPEPEPQAEQQPEQEPESEPASAGQAASPMDQDLDVSLSSRELWGCLVIACAKALKRSESNAKNYVKPASLKIMCDIVGGEAVQQVYAWHTAGGCASHGDSIMEMVSGALSTSNDKTWKSLKKKRSTRIWVPYAKAGLTAVLDNLRLEKASGSGETILDAL
jgi:hypothetical protein